MSKIRSALARAAIVAALGSLPTPLLADYQPTAEQRSACMGDAFKLCAADIPNTDRIINCLQRQKAQISPRCREVFNKAGH